jgi:hypothetical protein
MVAGALHPDRTERPWVPRYNILAISGEIREKTRYLLIKIYPRRWSEEFSQFMADFSPEASPVRPLEYLV